ncbi:MAG: hypothetical protein ACYSUI_18885 [Planctomycetota bacterium]
MARLVIPCFVEDDGHEAFLRALVRRLSSEEGGHHEAVQADFRSSAGGRGKALSSLRQYLRDVRRGYVSARPILAVVLDGNCQESKATRRKVLELADDSGLAPDQVLVGVPDPHIERWYLDQHALQQGVNAEIRIQAPGYKCERGRYKAALRKAFEPAGITPLAGGVEFASEILPHMDLEHPACGDQALKDFAYELRAALRRLCAGT